MDRLRFRGLNYAWGWWALLGAWLGVALWGIARLLSRSARWNGVWIVLGGVAGAVLFLESVVWFLNRAAPFWG